MCFSTIRFFAIVEFPQIAIVGVARGLSVFGLALGHLRGYDVVAAQAVNHRGKAVAPIFPKRIQRRDAPVLLQVQQNIVLRRIIHNITP